MTDEAKNPSPSRGTPVLLDKPRHLRYPLGVLRQIDMETELAKVLYLGLKHEDPDISVETIEEMLDLEMMPGLVAPLRKATGGLIKIGLLFDDESLDDEASEGGAEGNAGGQKPPG